MSSKGLYYGFGVNPDECAHHFLVIVPKSESGQVQIYERFSWTEGDKQVLADADILRLQISRSKWSRISAEMAAEFNARLKKAGIKSGRFLVGETPVDRLFGKEMMVLLWSIEDTDPSSIPTAIRNWKGLMPEEKWWLFTMTNASTGLIYDNNKGWRKALRFALCENPVRENPQTTLLDSMIEEK